ncbi:IclR family transcriptional regulator [uncultured Sneathiella sp.]|uniref:IclR family transcriptional regulator n=1 Tax=uncultured Sneathiella sp. TaxID=879315 RepID=UPI00259319C5|nr:IclR family transcriptional regulator [uncultured Sneathiella sp.]
MSAPTSTTARVLKLLRIAAGSEGPISIKEAADRMGVAQSTVHRMFDLLSDADFIRQDPQTRQYGIGVEFFRVAAMVTTNHSFGDFAEPVLSDLTARTQETAAFAHYVKASGEMIFATVSDSPQDLRYRLDRRKLYPITWGASGHAILAELPDEERNRIIAATSCSPVSGAVLDQAVLNARLAEARLNGWTWSQGEKIPESVGIAAPVFSAGKVTGCVALTIPSVRFDKSRLEEFGNLVKDAAAVLSVGRGEKVNG